MKLHSEVTATLKVDVVPAPVNQEKS
ncbi:MAG: hypothetical protein NTY64_20770 [Deltaproteobacteria bacterium]|nr:hypothetical protein [Deltaproteobacteria bacterium]